MTDSIKITVLGELQNKARNDLERKCLAGYDYKRSYLNNHDTLKSLSADILVAGAKLLNMRPLSDDGTKLYQNKSILSDRIILRIEALFDMMCGDCHSTYRNAIDHEPKLRCRLCLQGCHDCEESEKKVTALLDLQRSGLCPNGGVWLCNACLNKNDHDNLGKLKATKSGGNKDQEQNTTDDKKDLSMIKEEDGTGDETEESGDLDQDTDNTKRGSKISPRRDRSPHHEGAKHDHMKSICPLYVRRECPHGLKGNQIINGQKCAKKHPPRCRKYCGFGENSRLGCKKGRTCKYFHPKLCRNSELSHKCMNTDCPFVHLKRTVRPKREHQQEGTRRTSVPNYQQLNRDRRERNNSQPRLNKDMRSDSAWSVTSIPTPYPPTVGHKHPPAQPRMRKDSGPPRKDNSSSEQANFLGQLEEMKKGLYQKMDERFDALMSQIQDKLTRMEAPSTTASRPPSAHQMLPPTHPHMQTMHMQPPMTMFNPAQFQNTFF